MTDIKRVQPIISEEEEVRHRESHKFDEGKSFDYDRITDRIFIGTNMCCLDGYKIELLTKGINADISLEKERLDNPVGVDFFLWLPVSDKHAPTDAQLELGIANLDYFVRNGINVFVHCKNGHGRAPTLVAGYFVSQGNTVQQAIDMVSEARPEVHLEDEQIAALERYRERAPFKAFL